MALTDSERAEFIALTQDSYDPDLWDESDLPFLRKAKQQIEEEQPREDGDHSRRATVSDRR
jgi:hypothetical protein